MNCIRYFNVSLILLITVVFSTYNVIAQNVFPDNNNKSSDNSLVIDIVDFRALCNDNNTVKIVWTSKSEKEKVLYTVYKTLDAVTWEVLDTMSNNEDKLYSLIDNNYEGNVTYYQLKKTDLNGKDTWYDISAADCPAIVNSALIYPNPMVTTATITINEVSNENDYELKIYNYSGVEVVSKKITNQITSIESDNLSTGTYIYNLINNNKLIKSGILMLQK